MSSSGITVEALEKSYSNEDVLKGVEISIESDQFCVIVGPSGCGKTTLLDCIAGLAEANSGSIYYDGKNVTDIPVEDRDIGYVFQAFEDALFPHKTVAENIAFGLEQQGVPPDEIDQRIDEMLETLAITETKNTVPGELSGGQQQRVELARQLVRDCDIMLLDDPLADLDYKLQKRMELEIRRLQDEIDSTFVYVTHNQDQALKLADQLIVMNEGMIEQVGTSREVYERPANAFVARFIGDTNLLRASLQEQSGQNVVVDTPIGSMEASTEAEDIDLDTSSVVLIRPEDVSTGERAQNMTNTFTATIKGTTYTGEHTEHSLSVGNAETTMLTQEPGKSNYGTDGTTVDIGWDADDATFYEELSVTDSVTITDLEEI